MRSVISPPILVPIFLVIIIIAALYLGISPNIREHSVNTEFDVEPQRSVVIGDVWQDGSRMTIQASLINRANEPWELPPGTIRLLDEDGTAYLGGLTADGGITVPPFHETITMLEFDGLEHHARLFGLKVGGGPLAGVDLDLVSSSTRRGSLPKAATEPTDRLLQDDVLRYQTRRLANTAYRLSLANSALETQLNDAIMAREYSGLANQVTEEGLIRWRERERVANAKLAIALLDIERVRRTDRLRDQERELLQSAVMQLTQALRKAPDPELQNAMAMASDRLSRHARTLDSELEQQQKEVDRQQETIAGLEGDLDEARQELDDVRAEQEEDAQQLAALNSELDQARQQIEAAEQAAEKADDELSSLRVEHKLALVNLAAANAQLIAQRQELENAATQVAESVEASSSEIGVRREKLGQALQDVTQRLAATRSDAFVLEQTIAELRADLVRAELQASESESAKQDLQQQIVALAKQLRTAKSGTND